MGKSKGIPAIMQAASSGRNRQIFPAVLVVALLVVAGLYTLRGGGASSLYVATEPELGVRSGSTKVVSDSGASGGSALQFVPVATTSSIDTTFMDAWASGDHEKLRTWFKSNAAGPSTVSGTHAGGIITSQA